MIDTKKFRTCSHLLPDPGGEVVREVLDEIERLRAIMYEAAGRCESAAQEHGCEACRKTGTILHEAAEA